MKKFCALFFLFLFFSAIFADDDDEKQKLAVMEFEDLSGKLPAEMLSGATEYMRSAFVSANKFIVIAKERQEKAMIKEMKKESYNSCNDKNCQIPLGQALSADTILRTTINFFGGVYTITSELIDLAKEATISGAKQNFDGSESALVEALDRIVVQIAGTSVSYNVSAMKTQEIQGVKLGGVELSTMPKIEMKEADFGEVKSQSVTVEELSANIGISLDADPDVLVLYDKCVKADRDGEKNPQVAIDLWKSLAQFKEKNPFLQQAQQRISDWGKYHYSKQLAELFEKAKATDKVGQIFPEQAIEAWRNMVNKKGIDQNITIDNPYAQTAMERYTFWAEYQLQVEKYRGQLQKFEEQRKEDVAKLKKILPLEVITEAQKRTILVQYMEIYSPFYGIEDVNNIISSLSGETSKQVYGLLYNDYLKKEMTEKCAGGNGSACYISASLTEVEDQNKANRFFEQSCEKGIINACVKTAKVYYENSRFKDAAKLLYESCGMESPEGCHLAGYVTERGEGTDEDLIFAGLIYEKACRLGYDTSCKMAKKFAGLTPEKVAMMKLERLEEEERQRKKMEAEKAKEEKKRAEIARRKAEEEAHDRLIEDLNAAGRKKRLAAATGMFVPGLVLVGLGGFFFYEMKDSRKQHDKYYEYYLNSYYDDDIEKYRSKTKKAREQAQLFKILGTVGVGLGGVMFVTGIVLYSVDFKGEKEVKRKYNLSLGASPADGTMRLTLNW